MSTTAQRFAIAGAVAALTVLMLCTLVYSAAIMWPWLGLEPWSMRKARFAAAAKRSKPLVDAIKRYAQERGEPPDSLASLVPTYAARVPRTGLLDYPNFIYTRFTNTHYSLLWWDLGTRHGKPISGLWCYPEGDPDHAILALTLDQHRRVVDARVDRMPPEHVNVDFDPERWKRKEARMEMVRSLAQHANMPGQGTNEVFAILGSPDGESILRDAPWELKVKCPSDTGLDVFFYWPNGKYPNYIYGGNTERIGDWAYVHE